MDKIKLAKNQLKLEFLDRLTIEERGQTAKILIDSGYSYCKIAKMLNISQSTIHRWINGRHKQQQPNPKIKNVIDIDFLISYFGKYIPKDENGRNEIKRLALVLMDCAKR